MLQYQVVKHSGGEVDVSLRGSLADEDWTDRLEIFLYQHLVNDGVTLIRLDLSEVDWVDLEGIATLIRLANHTRDRGKRLVVAGATGLVREKLERTGVTEYLS